MERNLRLTFWKVQLTFAEYYRLVTMLKALTQFQLLSKQIFRKQEAGALESSFAPVQRVGAAGHAAGSCCAQSHPENSARPVGPDQSHSMNTVLEESWARRVVKEEKERKKTLQKKKHDPHKVDFLWVSCSFMQINNKTDVSPQFWHLPELRSLKVTSLI